VPQSWGRDGRVLPKKREGKIIVTLTNDAYAAIASFELAARLHDGSPRPVQPRTFGRREFERRNVYGFLSIKEGRAIEIDGLTALSVTLSIECDPKIAAYVERPRKLLVFDKNVELDFWVRHRCGREEFPLVVSEAECISNPGGTRSPREAARLIEAVLAASINIRCITEYDVRVEVGRIMVRNVSIPAGIRGGFLPGGMPMHARQFPFDWMAFVNPATLRQARGLA
jgi:hypothetical protein